MTTYYDILDDTGTEEQQIVDNALLGDVDSLVVPN
jgi:hypothetical protein